jgi:malate/lactate dehydrogenase
MDIHQGTPLFSEPVNVYAGNYESAAGSDIVVITSGLPRKPGQTRIDLAQTNVDIIKQIAPQIVRTCPDATYVIVSNPVDILTYVFLKTTGLPEDRVIGSGTLLDTARLRARIAEYLSVSQRNVHAYVFGEHGETSFIPWSIAEVSTINIANYKEMIKLNRGIMVDLDYEEIEKYMRSSGAKIIERKGCTNYAIAVSVCGICECFGARQRRGTVSTMLHANTAQRRVPVAARAAGQRTRAGPHLAQADGRGMEKLRSRRARSRRSSSSEHLTHRANRHREETFHGLSHRTRLDGRKQVPRTNMGAQTHAASRIS